MSLNSFLCRVCLTGMAVLVAVPSMAGTKYWNVANGDWNVATNWDPVGVPGTGDTIYIANGGTANNSSFLRLGNSAGEEGILHISLGTLNMAQFLQLGNRGKGKVIQTGGVVNCNESSIMAMNFGGYASAEGVYQISGGHLNVPNQDVWLGEWGKGVFVQTDGTVSFAKNLFLAYDQESGQPLSSGRYEISGGTVTIGGYAHVGRIGQGTFVQSGGTVTINQVTSNSSTLALYLGTQSGSTGTYQISGGTLRLPKGAISVGEYGTGLFIQTGGQVLIEDPGYDPLSIGNQAGSVGTYEISGGSLTAGKWPGWVGVLGTGTFIQRGGTVQFTTTYTTALGLAYGANAQGTYRISGGTLELPSGGLQVGTSGVARFEVIGSEATISLNGYGQNGRSTLGAAIDSGGISTITLSANGSFSSGASLDMDIEGGLALTAGKSFELMKTTSGTISGTPTLTDTESGLPYTVTNTGTVLRAEWSGAGYGPVWDSYTAPSEIGIPGGAASGYLTVLGAVPGRDVWVRLDIQDNSGPLSPTELDLLATYMREAGLVVYTSHPFLSAPYDLLALLKPTASTSYLAWDLTDYDDARQQIDGLVVVGLSIGVPEPQSFLLLTLGICSLILAQAIRRSGGKKRMAT